MMRLVRKLRFLLGAKSKRFAAVDFDSLELRVALAESTQGGTRINNLISVPIPEDLDVTDSQALGRFLGETLRSVSFGGAGIVMSVPRSQTVLKPLTLPPNSPTVELPDMVYYQVANELPFAVQDVVIDFTDETHYDAGVDETTGAKEINILVAAVRLSVIDHYRQVAEAAGVRLLRLGLRPYANMRCYEACEGPLEDRGVAIVHITADETEIDVLVRGSLVFSRSAVVDLSSIASADDLGIDHAAGSLAAEVARTLQSYHAMTLPEQVDIVLLAGATGIESQTARKITDRLGIPARILDPSAAFASGTRERVDSKFVSVLGLAIAHVKSEKLPFDFLNPKRRAVRRDTRKIRITAAAIVGVVLVLGAVACARIYIADMQETFKTLTRKKAQLSDKIDAVKPLTRRVQAIEAWRETRRSWLDHWAYLSSLFPSCEDVYLTALKTNTDGSISLTVHGRSNEAITELGRRLDRAGYKLTPGPIKTSNDTYGYPYNTSMRVFAPVEMKIDLATTQPVARPIDDSMREEFYRRASSK